MTATQTEATSTDWTVLAQVALDMLEHGPKADKEKARDTLVECGDIATHHYELQRAENDIAPTWNYVVAISIDTLKKRGTSQRTLEAKECARRGLRQVGRVADYFIQKELKAKQLTEGGAA